MRYRLHLTFYADYVGQLSSAFRTISRQSIPWRAH